MPPILAVFQNSAGEWKDGYMMLRRGQHGQELLHYENFNAFRLQLPPAGILNLSGCEVKVKAQNQVAASYTFHARFQLSSGLLRAF